MEAFSVESPRCEYLVDPLGIDESEPRLSWRLVSSERGVRQTSYRLRVASSAEALANNDPDLWDSGQIESDRCTHIPYGGLNLRSRSACYWNVEVWDNRGHRALSRVAKWSMGLLHPEDWSARWIAADPMIYEHDPETSAGSLTELATPAQFRTEFHIPSPVRRATLYASARGIFELRIGGRRVGDDIFAPEWTDYTKRIHYRTYDVTDALLLGTNALGAILGDGWWSGYVGWQEARGRYGSLQNSLIVQLEVELANGERLTITSGENWRCQTGPILGSDFMMGETYDARRERTGWDVAQFDDSDWRPAQVVAEPDVLLVSQRSEPVRITKRLAPIKCTEIQSAVFIYDLGQNIAGWVNLNLEADPGTRITLRHAERLTPDGRLYTENLRRATATDVITVGPSGKIDWQPHFTFHGFQFIELTGLDQAPPDDAVIGCVVQSATPQTGHFECSHPGVNRLWLNGVWSQRDNFLSVPTDCPQRDERLGWMGDAQVFLRTASYNANVAAFFTKWMVDIEDAQTEDGLFPDIAPRPPEGENFVGLDDLCGGAAWADAGVIIPFTIWQVYGDERIVERHWPAMVAWMDYLERTNPEYLRINDLRNNYGDWLCIPSDREFRTHSPMKNLLATAYWAHTAALMTDMARALGRDAEADHFERTFIRVRDAFQLSFLRPGGKLEVDTQTAYLLALAFNLLPVAVRSAATEHLVENIRKLDWHLSTGFIGIRHLNPELTLNGRSDVAYKLLLQDTYPSWLYPVKHGATTIWERWNGWTEEDGFFEPAMNSFNHYSLGSVGEWLYRHVAGIELDPVSPGFRHFILRPHPGGGLDYARASYDTLYGTILSGWEREHEKFTWSLTIPPNTSARVEIPSDAGSEVHENGKQVKGTRQGDRIVVELDAGSYVVESRYSS